MAVAEADPRIHPTITIHIDTSPKPSGDKLSPNSVSPPTTHVVQFPRENILRYPPPENGRKYHRRVNRPSCCCRCFGYTLCLLLVLAVVAAASAGILYGIFQFESPDYRVTRLATRRMNVTSEALVSPGFDVRIRAENPNDKVGIYYLSDNSVEVFFGDVKLGGGVLPAFYQPRKNVTVLQTALTGEDVVLGGDDMTALRNAQNQRRIPFVVRAKVPVKIKVGSAKTWRMIVRVKCDIAVDALNENATIVSKHCDFRVGIW